LNLSELEAYTQLLYSDDNHKPEMTIAVTPFEGLCGFRPLAEITHFLQAIQPLRTLVGSQAAGDFEQAVKGNEDSEDSSVIQKNKDALRSLFTILMESAPEKVETACKELVALAKDSPDSFGTLPGEVETNPSNPGELAEIIGRLDQQFPNDIGSFVFFFLNFVKLEPGEAMFFGRYYRVHGFFRQRCPRRLHP
jgi:mannose-6-phosphate isomerase